MTTSKVPLITAGVVAGVLLAQAMVELLVSWGIVGPLSGQGVNAVVPVIGRGLVNVILQEAAFGAGVFLSLRFVAPIKAEDGWRRVVVRGIIATAIGTAALLVYGILQIAITSVSPGDYFFGYSFAPTLDTGRLSSGTIMTLQSAIQPLIEWFPLVVLAGVAQRAWLAAHPVSNLQKAG